MVLSFAQGSWTSRTTTGTDVITGVGFTPKVIIIFASSYDVAFDTITGYIEFGVGGATDTTAANQRGMYLEAQDAIATTNTDSYWHAAAAIGFVLSDSSVNSVGVISAIGSDGFTVNWTAKDTTAMRLEYICLGGADITNAKIGSFTSPTTGTTGNQATTGVGFQPDLLIFFGCNATTDTLQKTGLAYGMGFATSSSNQVCLAGTSKTAVTNSTANTSTHYQRGSNTNCYTVLDETTTTAKGLEGAFVTMGSDGFTINWTTVAASGATKKIGYIAIKGGSFKVGSITAPVSGVTPVSQATTGIGFQPTGLLLASVQATSATTIGTGNKIAFGGGSSSTDRGCCMTGLNDATANTQTMALNKLAKITTNYAIVGSETSSTINAEADLTSLDSDGFTLSWTTRDTNAYEVLYVAVGNAAGAGAIDMTQAAAKTYANKFLTKV